MEEAHALVSLLTAPLEQGTQEDNWLVGTVRAKVQEYGVRVQGGVTILNLGSEDVYFDYVRCCVHALMTLKFELKQLVEQEKSAVGTEVKGPKLAADILSIAQAKAVGSLVQMVVALGILPNLLPGVGVPVDKRSDYLQSVMKSVPEKNILEKYKQLVFSLETLLELSKYKSFSTLIVTKHITDILGCLVQISYAPLMKPKSPEPTSSESDEVSKIADGVESIQVKEDAFVMTFELHERLSKDQERFKLELEKLLTKTYQPLVVKSLLVLQSSTKFAKGPKWFPKTVSQLLSSRLMAEGGVMAVVRGVLDLGGGLDEGMDWKQVGLVAEVLGNPPQSKFVETEKYYSVICPQLIAMLASEESAVNMIACSSIKAVADRSLTLSRRYLLEPLLRPMISLGGTEQEALAMTEQNLDDCIKNLFKIFVIGNDPSLMFVAHLEPVMLILMNLYLTIAFGVSHLKDPVKQLIEKYLKHSDRSTALVMIRGFAMDEVPQTTMNRSVMLNPDIAIVNGEEGGIKIVRKVDSEQTFYVSDDEKSIVVQDILDDMKDKALTTDFFLSLLEDLTVAMIDDDLEEIEPDLPEVHAGDVEQQLLDLEKHLDSTMHKMRRNLMVIRLLGLLSEDNNFQENLLKQSNKMITFVTSSIKRAAIGVAADVASSVMAVQSLNMALSILSVHLTQSNVPMEDWERMLDSADDLKTLESHADERIAKISGQLYNLVVTQGIVVNEVKILRENTKKIKEETDKLRNKAEQIKSFQKDQENMVLDEKKAQLKVKSDNLKKQKELRKKKGQEPKTPYETALFDISDPLIPVQGHGLISMTRLMEENDPETLDNVDKVRLLFQANLEDTDTYIYLNSIRGLVACARYSPDMVLETLAKEFSIVQDRKMEKVSNDGEQEQMQLRTKVGEALVQITRDLGEMAPKYKNLLLNSFFSVANDSDALVRASALSNMGEVCKLLRFSLGSITGEVLLHLSSCSKDEDPGVRAAAILVLTMILQGLGRDSFSVLQHSLRDIYRALKILNGVEKEETVRCHIGLALAEIDSIMRGFLTPDPAMEKKIYVLDTPPDCF